MKKLLTPDYLVFSHSKLSLGLHDHRPMDNNIWNHSPKVDLNKFDGSDPLGWVTQMEHYFTLQSIVDDMMKLRMGVLYLDLERWQLVGMA
jgi:hypothetical protein